MRRPVLASIVLAGVLAAGTAAANAQDIAAKARQAEELLSRGRVIEAIDALDDASLALWMKAPLAFRRAIWVAAKADGFGIFNPRPNNVFAAGEVMLVYAEPVGFGWLKSGDLYRTDLFADVVFRDAKGTELFRKDEFQRLELVSRYRNREFMVNFNYTLTGIRPGEYTVETTMRDQVTGKKGSFTLPFTVR